MDAFWQCSQTDIEERTLWFRTDRIFKPSNWPGQENRELTGYSNYMPSGSKFLTFQHWTAKATISTMQAR